MCVCVGFPHTIRGDLMQFKNISIPRIVCLPTAGAFACAAAITDHYSTLLVPRLPVLHPMNLSVWIFVALCVAWVFMSFTPDKKEAV